MSYQLMHGDSSERLKSIPDNSIDAIVTDPPYGLGKEPDALQMLKDWLETGNHEVKGGGFMGKCVHPDTEVLTIDGFKPVEKVSLQDKVYSLNPISGEIEVTDIVNTYQYDFAGDLYSIKGRSCEQLVTPNHRVWVGNSKKNFSFRSADNLPRTFIQSNQGRWGGAEVDTINILGKVFPMLPFANFMGLFLGDGYTVNRVNQPEKQDFFGFSVHKKRKVLCIRKTLNDLGVKYTENLSEDSGKTTFYIYDKTLLAYLKPLGGAHVKNIPHDLFRFSSRILEELYQGMISTDGCTQGVKDQEIYCSASIDLINDFQWLCFLTGRSCTINRREVINPFRKAIDPDTTDTCISYVASVLQKGKIGCWLERDGRLDRNQPKNVNQIPYEGKVYCVELKSNHIMLTRINGKSVWTGNSWDSFVPQPNLWKECLRVLKPGGYLLAFGGTRTIDLVTLGLRIAGFEVRDTVSWVTSQGFPKNHDISKAIDKKKNTKRDVVGKRKHPTLKDTSKLEESAQASHGSNTWSREWDVTAPATDDAKKWEGWGTALKPSVEPCVVCRKPLSEGTIVDNVLKHGTGAINIDGCRVGLEERYNRPAGNQPDGNSLNMSKVGMPQDVEGTTAKGRWPANLVLEDTDTVRDMFPYTVSGTPSGVRNVSHGYHGGFPVGAKVTGFGDDGSSSRFFTNIDYTEDDTLPINTGDHDPLLYCAKTSSSERNEGCDSLDDKSTCYMATANGSGNPSMTIDDQGKERDRFTTVKKNIHPTVKPIALMAWLCKLVTPVGGTVLDPFMGSGSTGIACIQEGFNFIGIEREDEYYKIAEKRILHAEDKQSKVETYSELFG